MSSVDAQKSCTASIIINWIEVTHSILFSQTRSTKMETFAQAPNLDFHLHTWHMCCLQDLLKVLMVMIMLMNEADRGSKEIKEKIECCTPYVCMQWDGWWKD